MYRCKWCKWQGSRIKEQIAQLVADVFPPYLRYVCWQCGNEVFPS